MTSDEFMKIGIEIFEEILRAESKHPEFPDDPVGMISILTEESGEAAREANKIVYDKDGKVSDLKKEVIQTACVCYRALQRIKKLKEVEDERKEHKRNN